MLTWLKRWLKNWWVVDLVGLVGLALCAGLFFFDVPNTGESSGESSTSDFALRALWPNLAVGLALLWLGVRVVDFYLKKRESSRREALWEPIKNHAYTDVFDAMSEFLEEVVPTAAKLADVDYHYFDELYTWSRVDFSQNAWPETGLQIRNEIQAWQYEINESTNTTYEQLAGPICEAARKLERTSLALQQRYGELIEPHIHDNLLDLEIALRDLRDPEGLMREGELLAGHWVATAAEAANEVTLAVLDVSTKTLTAEEYDHDLNQELARLFPGTA